MRVIFDFSDLVDFVCVHAIFSGIQRTQVDVYLQLRKQADIEVVPVYFSEISRRYFPLETDRLLSFDQRYLQALRHRPSRAVKLFRRVRRLWSFQPKQGDVIYVGGAGWNSPRRTRYLSVLRKTMGVHVVWMLFDLIPVSHPEFVADDNRVAYQEWIDVALTFDSTFVCISDFSRSQLLEYARSKGRTANAITVPLAHEFSTSQSRIRSHLGFLKNERFVLCVGTLEIRKNHLALVRLWERLFRELGNDTPILVLVGIRGWIIDRLNQFLDATGSVYGQVIHVEDADDAELAWLYEHCEFTVFPSLLEGWGLPVGESLWFGKPCICYDNSSLREVGGEHVIYCESRNNAAFEQAVRRAIDGNFAATPPPRSQLRTWEAVAKDIAEALRSVVR